MLNGLLRLADNWQSRSWLWSHSGRLLSGLGLATAFPIAADAARKNDRRGVSEEQEEKDAKDNRNEGGNAGDSDKGKNAHAQSDDKNSGEKGSKGDETRSSDKSDRDSSRDEGDGGQRDKAAAESDRQAARRQEAAAESDESPAKDNDGAESDRGGSRRSHDFEQTADDAVVVDEPAATMVAPTNPNVVITDIPQISDVDLVVEANPDVIASVSTSGGFAFARSGDVTAVTGPDGASIIRSGAAAPAPTAGPVEPSDDGGNNDLEFSS
ncbi:MAG: hypothetical protein KY456_04905 [Chloroflexi bacterium]|nr:hypothetical protein [Chloroflexota bacterium]